MRVQDDAAYMAFSARSVFGDSDTERNTTPVGYAEKTTAAVLIRHGLSDD
jgi:hypothetical protein